MRVIQVPMSEMLCPLKKSRKLGARSARHACEMPPELIVGVRWFRGGELMFPAAPRRARGLPVWESRPRALRSARRWYRVWSFAISSLDALASVSHSSMAGDRLLQNASERVE